VGIRSITLSSALVTAFILPVLPCRAHQAWQPIDSLSCKIRLPAGESADVTFDPSGQRLILHRSPFPLTTLAREAVDYAPDWLKVDLVDNLCRLDPGCQDEYASLILNTADPYVDEVAFEIAHLAPQALQDSTMDTGMLMENVESVYANDQVLDYVNIVDHGSAADGGDYYSTTRYWVAEEGDTVQYEAPKEIYYWFIVHPRLHKEFPAYIDPDTGDPAPPPTGVFWRDWLMNHADQGYPLLRDMLVGQRTLWNNVSNDIDNGAVGAITQWINDVLVFEDYPHHDQPVRIYRYHTGTCSVHSYLTAAASRAALIPTVVTVMYRDNHKVNEFWDRRWVHWEPVDILIDSPRTYDPGWGWNIAAAFDWRGDGYIWDVTKRYTDVCTLYVDVRDSLDHPVDAARIKLTSEGFVGWGATAGWTDTAGEKRFLLGDSRNFSGRVDSPIGTYPSFGTTPIITDSQVGETYYWDVSLPGSVPWIWVRPDSLPSNPLNEYKLSYSIRVPREIFYGINFDDGDEFSESRKPGSILSFICDSQNFRLYRTGHPLFAHQIERGVSSVDTSFLFPTKDKWHLVLSNEERVKTTQFVELTVRLYRHGGGGRRK